MSWPTQWWLISDLHLDSEAPDTRDLESVLPAFIDAVVLGPRPGHRNLVLLGDSFEVNGPTRAAPDRDSEAVRRLEGISRRFPAVFAALRRCLDAGVSVHVVCGNHDADLIRGPVRRELFRLLQGRSERLGALRLHPWVLHVPGLLYAEHGSQHHELNRMPDLLMATQPGRAGELAAAPLAVYARGKQCGRGAVPIVAGVATAMLASWRAEHIAQGPKYRILVERAAVEIGLPADTLAAIHDVSRFSPIRSASRTAARMAERRFGDGSTDEYLRSAVRRIDPLLAAAGRRPHCYVFGHTHVAALERLDGSNSYYVNTGTWSPYLRRGESRDLEGFPYVSLSQRDGIRCVRLEHWAGRDVVRLHPGSRQRVPVSVKDPPAMRVNAQA